MDKLTCMRAFVSVVEAGGFSRAERKTGISKTLLSKYVSQLENELKVRLLQRTTRQINLTEVGRNYYNGSIQVLEQITDLESAVHETHTSPSGELLISAPTSFAELHLMQVVSEFSHRHPQIRFTMVLTDRVVDIVNEGFDIALRIADLPDSSLVARRLCDIPMIICASPSYLETNGSPDNPRELTKHQCIIDSNFRGGSCWHFNNLEEKISVSGNYAVNSARAVRELAIRGNGVAICPTFVVNNDIKEGTLEAILTSYTIQPLELYAVYSNRRHLSTRVRLFVEILIEKFGPDWNNGNS